MISSSKIKNNCVSLHDTHENNKRYLLKSDSVMPAGSQDAPKEEKDID